MCVRTSQKKHTTTDVRRFPKHTEWFCYDLLLFWWQWQWQWTAVEVAVAVVIAATVEYHADSTMYKCVNTTKTQHNKNFNNNQQY